MGHDRPRDDLDASLSFSEDWWTSKRRDLYSWFKRSARHLAPVYLAGLRMAMDKAFPGRVCFVAHAMREIRNRLPDAIAGEIELGSDYHDLAKKVHGQWKGTGVSAFKERSEPSAAGPDRYEVSGEFMKAVSALVEAYIGREGSKRRNAGRLFEAIGEAAPPPFVVDYWLRTDEWVEEYMHVGNKPHGSEAEEEVSAVFEKLERSLMILSRGSSRPHENLEVLDGLLESANRQ